jgi:hypothetical protein
MMMGARGNRRYRNLPSTTPRGQRLKFIKGAVDMHVFCTGGACVSEAPLGHSHRHPTAGIVWPSITLAVARICAPRQMAATGLSARMNSRSPFRHLRGNQRHQLDAATQVNSYGAHTTDRGSVLLSRPGSLVRTPVDRCEYVLLNVL